MRKTQSEVRSPEFQVNAKRKSAIALRPIAVFGRRVEDRKSPRARTQESGDRRTTGQPVRLSQIPDSRDALRKVGGFEDGDITDPFKVGIVAGQEGETVLTHTRHNHGIVGEESSLLPDDLRVPDNGFIHW